jgi:hypothetical protein
MSGPGIFDPVEMLVFGTIGEGIAHEEETVFGGGESPRPKIFWPPGSAQLFS